MRTRRRHRRSYRPLACWKLKAIVEAAAQQFQNDSDQDYLVLRHDHRLPSRYRDADLAVKLARRAVELKPTIPVPASVELGDVPSPVISKGRLSSTKRPGRKTRSFRRWPIGSWVRSPEARTSFDGQRAELQRYEQECEAAEQQGLTWFL